ncbi:MAG: 50S ribosomal protein L9 [Planctomycetota bacterium]|jgi:large subunit ribosomal protein L9|nr:50S ribosomal protein L9 [Planctomycetota bacterium]MDP6519404.1 50S ribosomal protein L9 [Planctomycetota bacterium]MDP6838613.1 50S ribosomal protein L9 [Planctomycetota bacterium]MDP6956600.1 50S ribosomal protein L9 [Planctomycetota bacterium]
MKNVEVLLRDYVENLGRCGDVVKVASGYARNYLLPTKLAVPATDDNKKLMERRRARLDAEEAAHLAEIEARVAALSAIAVRTVENVDENGHLYGSVNAATICALAAESGYELDEKHVRLPEGPIRQAGEHSVRLHVHGEHFAEISVTVVGEFSGETAADAEARESGAEEVPEALVPDTAPSTD